MCLRKTSKKDFLCRKKWKEDQPDILFFGGLVIQFRVLLGDQVDEMPFELGSASVAMVIKANFTTPKSKIRRVRKNETEANHNLNSTITRRPLPKLSAAVVPWSALAMSPPRLILPKRNRARSRCRGQRRRFSKRWTRKSSPRRKADGIPALSPQSGRIERDPAPLRAQPSPF